MFFQEQRSGIRGVPTKAERAQLQRQYRALPQEEVARLKGLARRVSQQKRRLRDPAVAGEIAAQRLGRDLGQDEGALVVVPHAALRSQALSQALSQPGSVHEQLRTLRASQVAEARHLSRRDAAKRQRCALDMAQRPMPQSCSSGVRGLPSEIRQGFFARFADTPGYPAVVECRPISTPIAEKVVQRAGAPLLRSLGEAWEARHCPILHETAPQLFPRKGQRPGGKPTRCELAGICLCRGAGRTIAAFSKARFPGRLHFEQFR